MQDRSFGWVCGGLVSALLTVGGCADRGDFGFVEDAGPAWLAPEDIGPDGLLLDRLEIVLAADASAKDLDRALDAVGGEVGASSAGRPWMVVTVPSGADADAMEALADTLAAQPGVAYAGTAWLVSPEVVPLEPVPLAAPSGIGASANFALGDHRFFAAWNASRLAKAKVPVYVVDAFATHDAVDQLSAMRFVGPDAARRVALPAPSDRNHGHWVASLIGADFDPVPPLGTHPDPTATLDLVGIDYGSVGGA
ncbi:MAG: hypothetical protein R3F61_36420, partial [Myxococcota bacterium]